MIPNQSPLKIQLNRLSLNPREYQHFVSLKFLTSRGLSGSRDFGTYTKWRLNCSLGPTQTCRGQSCMKEVGILNVCVDMAIKTRNATTSGEAWTTDYRYFLIWLYGKESINDVYLDNRSFSMRLNVISIDSSLSTSKLSPLGAVNNISNRWETSTYPYNDPIEDNQPFL